MKAMVLDAISDLAVNRTPLRQAEMPVPIPGEKEVLIRVSCCGVCHTELDEIEGRTPPPFFPLIPGHQIVGRVDSTGLLAERFRPGDRVGVAWIHSACGRCDRCREGRENLCAAFEATGRDVHGGYAEYTTVSEDFAYLLPPVFSDSEAAPLLCAGAIGYRSLRLTGLRDGENIGLTGFGASAHLVMRLLNHTHPGSKVFVFSRTQAEREFARELGAYWTGDAGEETPERLQAVIDTTPAWRPVVKALRNLDRGGRLVINAIRKETSDRDSFLELDYSRDLWMEKEIRSVANITRRDVEEFLALAAETGIRPEVQEYQLEEANVALLELKARKIRGAKVLRIG